MSNYLRIFWNALLPDEMRWEPDVLRQAKRVAALDLAMFVWVVIFAWVYHVLALRSVLSRCLPAAEFWA